MPEGQTVAESEFNRGLDGTQSLLVEACGLIEPDSGFGQDSV